MDTGRPERLKYKSRSGIFDTYFRESSSRAFTKFVLKAIQWSDSCEDDYSDTAEYRLLDTFMSDSLTQELLSEVFNRSRSAGSVKILLANCKSQFAIARSQSIGNTPAEVRATNGLRRLLGSIYDTIGRKNFSDDLTKWTYENLLESIHEVKSQVNLDLKFYSVAPSGPMFFFKDILLYGRYCANESSKDLPWNMIVDDTNESDDMYDVFNKEFSWIWEKASQHIEGVESSLYNYLHKYFISYSSKDAIVADHIELLLWRQNRFVSRDERNFASGENLSSEVQSVIDNSQTFLVLLSKNYSQSIWCQDELAYARQICGKGGLKRLIAIRLDHSDIPLNLSSRLHLNGLDRQERQTAIQRIIDEEASQEY